MRCCLMERMQCRMYTVVLRFAILREWACELDRQNEVQSTVSKTQVKDN